MFLLLCISTSYSTVTHDISRADRDVMSLSSQQPFAFTCSPGTLCIPAESVATLASERRSTRSLMFGNCVNFNLSSLDSRMRASLAQNCDTHDGGHGIYRGSFSHSTRRPNTFPIRKHYAGPLRSDSVQRLLFDLECSDARCSVSNRGTRPEHHRDANRLYCSHLER